MKVLLVADTNSIHTIRWKEALEERDVVIDVFGIPEEITSKAEGALSKLSALKLLPQLKKRIKSFKPDILHAHYASSYGLLSALAGFHHFILSVLGGSESFGVAIIEASACGKPVVVSNVGGLPEVVKNEKTGLIVERKSPKATAQAIQKLLDNPDLRKQLGKQGRQHVIENYDWDKNVDQMVGIYTSWL